MLMQVSQKINNSESVMHVGCGWTNRYQVQIAHAYYSRIVT